MKDNRPFDGAEHITLDSDICLADRHCPSIMKNIFIIVLLLSTFVVFPITAAETGSGIVLRPHDETVRKELLRGHTYTSEDCSDIKSGTMTVSEDGYTLTLDNLVLECSKDGDEGSLLRFDPNELYTLSLTGENVVSTNGYAAIVAGDLIITGEGSLTTKSRYFDIHSYFGRTVWIDNTTLICQGQRAILSEGGKVSVFNSRFEGNELRGVSQLSMIDCSIKVPYNGWFDPEEKDKSQIKNEDGVSVSHFVIANSYDTTETPSPVHLFTSTVDLLCGHTYTSADFGEIKSGSMSVSEDGSTLTLSNLEMESSNEEEEVLIYIDTHEQKTITILLEGDNLLRTEGREVLSIGSIYQNDIPCQVKFTGSGSLTTKSNYFDLYLKSGQFIFDHTRLKCLNSIAAPASILVKESRFEGTQIHFCPQLELEGCVFKQPINGWFDPEAFDFQIKDGYGGSADYFLITPPDDDIVPSYFRYKGEPLLCGRTYTSADFGEIQSGSITMSENGVSMTFDNLTLNNESEDDGADLFSVRGNGQLPPFTVVLNGENKIYTKGSTVMKLELCTFTLTGDGSLTTQSKWIDFFIKEYCGNFIIDNTTLTCEGPTAIGHNMPHLMYYLVVKHSTFKGSRINHAASMTLINSAFVNPAEVYFDLKNFEKNQFTDADGNYITHFEIQPVEGDFRHRVSPWDLDVIVVKGKTKNVDVSMKNDGEETVKEISYVVSIDGKAQPEQNYSLNEPYPNTGNNFNVPISFPASETTGSVELLITVTKVNGQENTSDQKTAKGTLITISKAVPQRVVLEEFTGTWCGWCPRGTVALNLLNQEFGDSVITIAVHNGDPMKASSYTLGSNSNPSSMVNRGYLIDPYYGSSGERFGIRNDIERELNNMVLVGITVSAAWADEAQTVIQAETETTFLTDADPTDYGIGYALLEDGMKGTGRSWAQNNFYSGKEYNDPNLLPMTTSPGWITDIEYNHVAVDAWSINNGVDNCFNNIEIDVPQKNVYLCDIAANSLIQDKSRLSVVVLLIDRKNSKIINAAKTTIKDYDPSAIRDIHEKKSHSSAIYSINGYQMTPSSEKAFDRLPKGIYVIDGRKIVVK